MKAQARLHNSAVLPKPWLYAWSVISNEHVKSVACKWRWLAGGDALEVRLQIPEMIRADLFFMMQLIQKVHPSVLEPFFFSDICNFSWENKNKWQNHNLCWFMRKPARSMQSAPAPNGGLLGWGLAVLSLKHFVIPLSYWSCYGYIIMRHAKFFFLQMVRWFLHLPLPSSRNHSPLQPLPKTIVNSCISVECAWGWVAKAEGHSWKDVKPWANYSLFYRSIACAKWWRPGLDCISVHFLLAWLATVNDHVKQVDCDGRVGS